MKSLRTATLVVVMMATVAVTSSVPAQDGAGPSIEDVPDPIVEVLRDYAKAFVDKDVRLLGATVDGSLLEAERKALANAASITFSSFVIEPVTQYSGDLASSRVRASYPEAEVRTYHVVEQTRIGAETDTYEEDGAYTFTRVDDRDGYDGWRLASKDDLDALGFFSPFHLWDTAPVSVVTSERFILLTHPDTVDVMRPVLQVAEDAYDRVAKFWPRQLDETYVIVAPSTTDELRRILHATIDLDKFVAFVAAGVDREDGWEPTGPRMFIHVSHLRNYGRSAQTEILAHELVHAVTRPASGPHIPVWVEEGLANFGGGTGGRASAPRGAPVGDEFPTQERFVTGPVSQIQAVYDQSQVAIEVLDREFGRDGLADFYEVLGRTRVAAGTEEYHVRNAVRGSVGWSYEEWLAAWRDRLR